MEGIVYPPLFRDGKVIQLRVTKKRTISLWHDGPLCLQREHKQESMRNMDE